MVDVEYTKRLDAYLKKNKIKAKVNYISFCKFNDLKFILLNKNKPITNKKTTTQSAIC